MGTKDYLDCLTLGEMGFSIERLDASKVRKSCGLEVRQGRRAFVELTGGSQIEMVWLESKGAAGGYVWYFVNPLTQKRCRTLYIQEGKAVHRSQIKDFYRKRKPIWWEDSPIGRFLEIQQKALDARKAIAKPYFRKSYKGKPTKRYLRLLQESGRYVELSDHDLLHNLEAIAAGY